MKLSLKKIKTIIFATIALSVASYAYAGGAFVELAYYSDASYSTIVGERVINQCRGTTYTSGQVTQYVKVLGSEPCGR